MKSREAWVEEQERALAVYDEVREELLQIPGVVEVGVGIKETGGELTEHVAFRVYVEEKLPESEFPADKIIPKTIRGFPTDVIKRRDQIPAIGFNDEDDSTNYAKKVGGIRIGSENGGGTGTLGCFCRRTTDNKVVFLSNHHVLFSGSAQVGSKVGQPDFSDCCCCTCNSIGTVADGQAGALDCAIATLNSDVPFFTKIKTIKRDNGTVEQNGAIAGNAPAVMSDEVWKVGARTGLTRGTITQVAPDVELTPLPAFPRFAFFGDSGSVVVRRISGDVVGLLKSIDAATETLAFATPIAAVLTAMHITITPTDVTQDFDVLAANEEADPVEATLALARQHAFNDLARRLETSEVGRRVLAEIDRHRPEAFRLVNNERAVTVAWHRSKGPTFLAALARSAREPAYRIPAEIEGVTREQALRSLGNVFTAYGSPALRAAIEVHGPDLIDAFLGSDTVAEYLEMLEALPLSPLPVKELA